MQVVNKKTGNTRILNQTKKVTVSKDGKDYITNNYEKTVIVIDESILNPELYDLENEKNRQVTNETIDKVIAKLKELKKAPQRDILTLIRIAEAYLEVKDYQNSLNIFSQVLEVEPQNLAILDYNKAIKINPNYADAYNNRGIAYYNLKKYNLAISDFAKAIEINPNYSDVYNNRGVAYYYIKQFRKAKADAIQVFELSGNRILLDFLISKGL